MKEMKRTSRYLTFYIKALVLSAFCLMGYAHVLVAQVQQPVQFNPRKSSLASAPYTNVQNYTLQGDFTMIGNTNLTLSPYSDGGNNSDNMVYVDIDGDASTLNSSSATLQLPGGINANCTNIIYAGLYWTGRPGDVGNTFSRTKTVKGSLIPINSTDKIL